MPEQQTTDPQAADNQEPAAQISATNSDSPPVPNGAQAVSPPEAADPPQEAPPAVPASPPQPDARDTRIAALEAEIAGMKTAGAALSADITALRTAHDQAQAQAAGKYRALALAASPEIPGELVAGGTIDQVEASLTTARAVVQKVREQIAAQQAAAVTPGSPQRAAPDTESLSPIDKIKYAVTHRNNNRR